MELRFFHLLLLRLLLPRHWHWLLLCRSALAAFQEVHRCVGCGEPNRSQSRSPPYAEARSTHDIGPGTALDISLRWRAACLQLPQHTGQHGDVQQQQHMCDHV